MLLQAVFQIGHACIRDKFYDMISICRLRDDSGVKFNRKRGYPKCGKFVNTWDTNVGPWL